MLSRWSKLILVSFLVIQATSAAHAQVGLSALGKEASSFISTGAGVGTLHPESDPMLYFDVSYQTTGFNKPVSIGISWVKTRLFGPTHARDEFARRMQVSLDLSTRFIETKHSSDDFSYGLFLGFSGHFRRGEEYLETIIDLSLEDLEESVDERYPCESCNPRYYSAWFYSFSHSELEYAAAITKKDEGIGLGGHVGVFGDFFVSQLVLGIRFKVTRYHRGASHWGPSIHLGWRLN